MEKSISIKNILMTAGAFISFCVGVGFASGNELLQFFGSWEGSGAVISLAAGFVVTVTFCICLFMIGQSVVFNKSDEAYFYFGGKYLGKFYQIFVVLLIIMTAMQQFSGAGSLLWQEYGFPQWIGAVILGILSVIIVLGGLKTVQNVLGSVGILILAYVLLFGVISLISPDSSLSQAAGVAKMVEEGKIFQANMFTIPPLSWIPGALRFNSPFIEGVLYGSLCVTTGFPFFMSLGRKQHSEKEAVVSGVVTSIAFYACIILVLMLIMCNFNSVINPTTDEMFPFPAVAAVGSLWPSGRWTYVLIIFLGLLTTYIGYLWSINNVFFEGKEKTLKSKLFVIFITIFGICLGSVLPFSKIINILLPINGMVGFLMTISIVIKTFKFCKTKSSAQSHILSPE